MRRQQLAQLFSLQLERDDLNAAANLLKIEPLIITVKNSNFLHIAARRGNLEMLKFLLENQCDIDSQNKSGQTPLYVAVYHNHYAIVDELIKMKCNPNIPDQKNYTPLMIASQKGLARIVQSLLKANADPNTKNKNGQTALDLCKSQPLQEILRPFMKRPMKVNSASCGLLDRSFNSVSKQPRINVQPLHPINLSKDELIKRFEKVQASLHGLFVYSLNSIEDGIITQDTLKQVNRKANNPLLSQMIEQIELDDSEQARSPHSIPQQYHEPPFFSPQSSGKENQNTSISVQRFEASKSKQNKSIDHNVSMSDIESSTVFSHHGAQFDILNRLSSLNELMCERFNFKK